MHECKNILSVIIKQEQSAGQFTPTDADADNQLTSSKSIMITWL